MALIGVATSRSNRPLRTLIYGVDGIGKTTFASRFSSPVFIPAEDGVFHLDVPSFAVAESLDGCWDPLCQLLHEPHDYRTVVVDTLDWVDIYMAQYILGKWSKDSLSDFGYGKGWQVLEQHWFRYLASLDSLVRTRGMSVVLLSHSQVQRYAPPGQDAYDVYTPKLEKNVRAMVSAWADNVLFCNYLTYTRVAEENFGKERLVAVGGQDRVLYCVNHASHSAKNRLGMPAQLPFVWEAVSPYFYPVSAPVMPLG